MKKSLAILALLLAAAAIQLHAQKTNTWKGGFPGQETNWNCPRNWSLGVVPDWACQVIVPEQTGARKNYPVLSTRNEEIYSLVMQPGTSLEIAAGGELTVSGLNPEIAPTATLILRGKFETPGHSNSGMAQLQTREAAN